MTDSVAIGIDLGGTNCRAALVSANGRESELKWIPTDVSNGYELFVEEIIELCRQLRTDATSQGRRVCAVGMGAPGIIASDGTVRVSPNLTELNGHHLARDLSDRLNLPTRVVNDANAICWGEALWGAGRTFNSFLTVTLGTGVGGGLVLDREIWTGADGAAGEVGHLTVFPEGRLCGCGSHGCLEQYASASGIVREIRRRLQDGEGSALASVASERLTCQAAAQMARNGDSLALSVFEQAGKALGQVLAGIANLLNLDGVVITGGAADSFDLLLPQIQNELRERAFEIPARRLQVVRGELGDDAGILGVAGMVLQ